MKVVQINSTCGAGSTGKICVAVSKLLTERGVENYILYTHGQSDYPLGIKYATSKYLKLQAFKSRLFGNYGFNSRGATKRLISHLERISPDVVQLHNIHGHDCNLEMLFAYFKRTGVKVYWTLHDCWSFTGYCPYFDMAKCEKWLTQCHKCQLKGEYSWFFDKSRKLFERKKRIYEGVDLTIIAPSEWIKHLASQSILKERPSLLINNGIDLDVFKPIESDLREKYGLQDKHIILGVAFDWGKRKGLSVFKRLAEQLGDDYQIIMVGTNNSVDKKLPENIIKIHKTHNQEELAQLYTLADVLVNPTLEENYPSVNMESIACGTPVVTYNTGGSPESLDECSGSVIEKNNFEALKNEVVRICKEHPYSVENCLARAKSFAWTDKFAAYCDLYLENIK